MCLGTLEWVFGTHHFRVMWVIWYYVDWYMVDFYIGYNGIG